MNISGSRVSEMRIAAGLTQSELADIVGVSQATISRIETAEQNVDARIAARIAGALECTLVELEVSDSKSSHRNAAAFYTICQNPFCPANELKKNGNGAPVIHWKSANRHEIQDFDDINFCHECGADLVKDCPNCKRILDSPKCNFCTRCGERLYTRPTSKDWEKINQKLKQTPEPENDIPF